MKRTIILLVMAGFLTIGLNLTSCSNASDANTIYQCEMHPEVTSDKPGKCPKCGMDLMQVKKTEMKKADNAAAPDSTKK
jgi:hypothetical protein